jgi:hypothetical protein
VKLLINYLNPSASFSEMMMYSAVGISFTRILSFCGQIIWATSNEYDPSAVIVKIGPVPLSMHRDRNERLFRYSKVSSDESDNSWDDPEQHITWECARMLGEDVLCAILTQCDCTKEYATHDQ